MWGINVNTVTAIWEDERSFSEGLSPPEESYQMKYGQQQEKKWKIVPKEMNRFFFPTTSGFRSGFLI